MTVSSPPFEPYRIKAIEPIPTTTLAERERALSSAGYNLFGIPADKVTIDLLTDSGTGAMSAAQYAALLAGDESYAGSRSFYRFESAVQELTGYAHVVPTHQGRAAERVLFTTLCRPGDVVPGNTHFDTTRANLKRAGARPLDLPSPEMAELSRPSSFKGDIDLDALDRTLREHCGRVPLVIVTITNNAAGGQPVSLRNIRLAGEICRSAGVPLFLDAARFAENAFLVKAREPGQSHRTIREIVRDAFDQADGCLVSAKKDCLGHIGGFLAFRDPSLVDRLAVPLIEGEGYLTYGGLAGRDLAALAVGIAESTDEAYLANRIAQVGALWTRLFEGGVPVVAPAGAHAVYVDAARLAPHIPPQGFPGQAVACELYRAGGIRSCEIGTLMMGEPDPAGALRAAPWELVRLAIPRRVYTESHLHFVADSVLAVRDRAQDLDALEIVRAPEALRHFSARLRPRPELGPGIAIGTTAARPAAFTRLR